MCIFSYRNARLSLKEAFRVIFARNCNDRRRCRVSSSLIILSSSHSLLDFSSFFFSLFYLSFLFPFQLPCAALQRYHVANIVISRSSASPPTFKPGAIETGKSYHRNSSIRQFLEPFRDYI